MVRNILEGKTESYCGPCRMREQGRCPDCEQDLPDCDCCDAAAADHIAFEGELLGRGYIVTPEEDRKTKTMLTVGNNMSVEARLQHMGISDDGQRVKLWVTKEGNYPPRRRWRC